MDKSTFKGNTIGHSRVKIRINEVQLKEVTSFQYLSATLSKDGSCTADICIRTSSTTTTDYGTTTVSALPPSTGGTNLPPFPSFCTVVRCGLCLVSIVIYSRDDDDKLGSHMDQSMTSCMNI